MWDQSVSVKDRSDSGPIEQVWTPDFKLTIMWRKDKETTLWRFAVGIGNSRTFEWQYLLATEGANPPKIEFFDAVAGLKAGLAQFSNVLGQRG
jgi:hypothetical protein